MFEQRLPYGLWDADQHFPERADAIPDYIEPRFRDRVAIDVPRRERDQAREAAKLRLRRGQALGGGKLASREEVHDRAKLR